MWWTKKLGGDTYLTWEACTSCSRCPASLVTWSACMWSHLCLVVWLQQVIIFVSVNHPRWPQEYHISKSQKVFVLGFLFVCFSFLFSQLHIDPMEEKPWDKVMVNFKFGTDSIVLYIWKIFTYPHSLPRFLWFVSGASPSNSACSAFYPLYYSSVLTHKTFQTLEMVQCIMVFRNMQYLCLNEKNKYLGSFCTCQQYSVKQYV